MSKNYIIISTDNVGYWAIEGVFDNFETACNVLSDLVTELNKKIEIINSDNIRKKFSLLTEKYTIDEFDKEMYPNVLISYSNNLNSIEIIELETNKLMNKISDWYITDFDD